MTEYQKETAFLRYVMAFDDTAERRELEERVAQVQRDERCAQRAASLMALVSALFAAALSYAVILHENFPYARSELVFNLLCGFGSASLISVVVLVGLSLTYHTKLNRLRAECRFLVTKLLEFHLGTPHRSRLRDHPVGAGNGEVTRGAVEGNGALHRLDSGLEALMRVDNKISPETNSRP
jgi:hypothetical protein